MASANETTNIGELDEVIGVDQGGGFIPEGYVPPTEVNRISLDTVFSSIHAGIADFKKAAVFSTFFGFVYFAAGLLLTVFALVTESYALIFPLAAGFLLVGPITALGLYEISRRIETGERVEWDVLKAFKRHGVTHVFLYGFTLAFLLIVWLVVARVIYALNFGYSPSFFAQLSLDSLIAELFTARGLAFLVVGNAFGAVLAGTVFAITVVGVPYLHDRPIDFMTAIMTSVHAVAKNPGPMLIWGVIIALTIGLSAVFFFFPLIFTLPIIGHATWHLYKQTVVPND
ncbi:MAG: DUF2189 domain-containing protein [Devosiaceae bacterium]|nr:DUF2189 domain-containing protein [Devosiaceae bacterium MH13]